jgi:hypothetical protein
MDPSKISQVKHLSEVERLTIRQIARELRMCTKTVSRIIAGRERPKKAPKPTLLARYLRLIDEWYMKRPSLKATQVYERLKDYGYVGKYTQVSAYTRSLRKRRSAVYHELEFLPGQCAQVDWMAANLPFGKVHGFVFILAWSRYLFVRFYPRSSMEFFLDGHIEACREIGEQPGRTGTTTSEAWSSREGPRSPSMRSSSTTHGTWASPSMPATPAREMRRDAWSVRYEISEASSRATTLPI